MLIVVPSIILPRSEQALIVTEGDNITCTAAGYPIPNVVWLSDNKSVISVMAEGVGNLSNVSASLTMRRSDGGFYTCLASNFVGNDISSIHIIVQCKLSLKLFY